MFHDLLVWVFVALVTWRFAMLRGLLRSTAQAPARTLFSRVALSQPLPALRIAGPCALSSSAAGLETLGGRKSTHFEGEGLADLLRAPSTRKKKIRAGVLSVSVMNAAPPPPLQSALMLIASSTLDSTVPGYPV